MDFLNSYFPWSPSKGPPPNREQQAAANSPGAKSCEDDTSGAASSSSTPEKAASDTRPDTTRPTVQFLAPLSEEGDSLQSVHLTPKTVCLTPCARAHPNDAPRSESAGPEQSPPQNKDKFVQLFGFKIRKNNFLK